MHETEQSPQDALGGVGPDLRQHAEGCKLQRSTIRKNQQHPGNPVRERISARRWRARSTHSQLHAGVVELIHTTRPLANRIPHFWVWTTPSRTEEGQQHNRVTRTWDHAQGHRQPHNFNITPGA